MNRNAKELIEKDIDFLNEIKEDIEKYFSGPALEKIDDWVRELEELLENRF